MPKLTSSVPRYRKHRGSGQAVITIGGKDLYLGPHGTKASHLEYDRMITEWLAAGRPSTWPQSKGAPATISELIRDYFKWAKSYYRDMPELAKRYDVHVSTIHRWRLRGIVPVTSVVALSS